MGWSAGGTAGTVQRLESNKQVVCRLRQAGAGRRRDRRHRGSGAVPVDAPPGRHMTYGLSVWNPALRTSCRQSSRQVGGRVMAAQPLEIKPTDRFGRQGLKSGGNGKHCTWREVERDPQMIF